MDGSEARNLHPTTGVSERPRWVGGHGGCGAALGAILSEMAANADLGGNSKYSNENFED